MDELSPIVIDLNKLKGDDLDESFLAMFGWGVKRLLKAVFGDVSIPVHLKGSKSDVKSFLSTLGAEKSYINDFKRYGLDDPRTYRSKSSLSSAVGKFERGTGIKWPFK